MGDDSGPFLTRNRLVAAFVVLGASSIWVTSQPSDQPPLRRDSFPDSVSTAAILPADVTALVDSAETEERRGDWSMALSHLQRATRGNPRDARAALALARCFRWTHRHGELIIAANNAVVLAPTNLDAIVERVRASIVLGKLENARAILDTVPMTPTLQAALANARLQWVPRASAGVLATISVPDAEQMFERAKSDPDVRTRIEAEAELARALAAAGEVERAVTILQRLTNSPSEISNASLRIDPAWTRLRGDKRFAVLLGDPI